ncbi:hypothetical protein [Mesorhizobium sp. M0058]|uniref:hypothetical protein n=1 Tax=Mesorhizobium sp. M0058 TaxID=2956865 RepID=UPI0033383DC2
MPGKSLRVISQIEVGSLTTDEMSVAMKAIGMSFYELDREIAGDVVDFHGVRCTALRRLLRSGDGPDSLRKAVHSTLLRAAEKHVNFLTRSLCADFLPES